MAEELGSLSKEARSMLENRLSLQREEPIDPDLPIIDAHHHLRDYRKKGAADYYLFEDLLKDVSSGHNIRATVAVECHNMYRADGPPELRSVGQTEFLNGIAAMFASGQYGSTLGCAGIVGFAELRLGDRVGPILDAHIAAGGGRFRGVRNPATWDDSEQVRLTRVGTKGVLLDPHFRRGLACLAARDLSYDAWVYHPQLPELVDLARSCPASVLIVNHCGGPLAIGPYAGKRSEVFAYWSAQLRELARCPGVFIKLGGLASPRAGFGFDQRPTPASSEEIAQAWKPYVETCIEIFGPKRCMFESNFPPDKVTGSYTVIWNALKRIAASYSAADKAALFSNTAAAAYRLEHVLKS